MSDPLSDAIARITALEVGLARQATMGLSAPSGMVPTGAMLPFGGAAAPTGYLLCDGSNVLRSDYAALFAAIGTAFGSADGTHFNLPDLRTKFARGKGAAEVLGATGGAAAHTPAGTNSGGAVDAHAGTNVSAHSGAAVSSHAGATVADHTLNLTHAGAAVATHPATTITDHPQASWNGASGGSNVITAGTHTITETNTHSVTQPNAHTNTLTHTVGQPNDHSVTQPAAHTITQPNNHVFTQPTFTGSSQDTQPPFVNVNFIIKT